MLELDREAELPDLVRPATSRLVGDLGSSGVEVDILVDDGPSASFVAYSSERREVWRVGDCLWLSEEGTFPGGKAIDPICANARSAPLHALETADFIPLALSGRLSDELQRKLGLLDWSSPRA